MTRRGNRFRQQAADAFTPSLRQRIDLARINRRAISRLPPVIDAQPPGPLPDLAAVTLEEWFDVD